MPSGARRSVDRDGVVETELPRARVPYWVWALAVPAFAGLVCLVVMWRTRTAAPKPAAEVTTEQGAVEMAPGPVQHEENAEAMPSKSESAIDEPAADDEDETEGAPRGREGIAAFPPPGTKRIKVGLVVPDDFPLPNGYMRHYQTTDKGDMLRAILMFHPDYKPVDARGKPVPLPEDRIVPPEMAPPGMPLERLEVPVDAYTDAGAARALGGKRK